MNEDRLILLKRHGWVYNPDRQQLEKDENSLGLSWILNLSDLQFAKIFPLEAGGVDHHEPSAPAFFLEDVDVSTDEGRLLMAALAVISVECRPSKTMEEIITELAILSEQMTT